MSKVKLIETQSLVVGGGIAGLVACFNLLKENLNVTLATDKKLAQGASYSPIKASLGIQVTSEKKADLTLFQQDLVNIGNQMDTPDLIDTYIKDSPSAIQELNNIGFAPWLRDDNRPACFAKHARNIFLIKDWQQARKNAKHIFNHDKLDLLEEHRLIKLFSKDNQIIGALFLTQNQEYLLIKSKHIILATGGISGLYKNSFYPFDVNGAGHIAAIEAGAKLINMEFIQFIPAFITPKYNVLFGEHTAKYCTLLTNDKGENLLAHLSKGEQEKLWQDYSAYAPFSFDFSSHVIDLAIFDAINKGSEYAQMHFSDALYQNKEEFYTLYLNWLKSINIDMCQDKIGIAHFAHSCNGGIKISIDGESDVKGLYAVGEIASAIEGANRLGGNSVGGALVFAKRAVAHILKKENTTPKDTSSVNDSELLTAFEHWRENEMQSEKTSSFTPREVIAKVQNIVSSKASVVRSESALLSGLKELDEIAANFSLCHNQHYLGFSACSSIKIGQILLSCMLTRTESRGAHYRQDHPTNAKQAYKIEIAIDDNEIKTQKIPVVRGTNKSQG